MAIPNPETISHAEFPILLAHLRTLLRQLPDTLPIGDAASSKYQMFLSFKLDADLLEQTGSEIGALNEQFKAVFGWKTRTTGDGLLSIDERGPAVCAVVNVLEGFHHRHPDDNIIKKWAVDIAKGATQVYVQHGVMVIQVRLECCETLLTLT